MDSIYIGCIFLQNIDSLTLEVHGDDPYLYEWDLYNTITGETTQLYDGLVKYDLKDIDKQYMFIHSRKNQVATKIESPEIENKQIYDIYGNAYRSADDLQSGLYIINGKKTLRKN